METNGRNPTSRPSSRSGTQTPKLNHQVDVAEMTKHTQPLKSGPSHSAKEPSHPFSIPLPGNDRTVSEKTSNAIRSSEPRQSPANRTPGPRDTPVSLTKDSPNEQFAKSHESHAKPVQTRQPIEIDEQSSSSSNDDTANPPADAKRTEEAMEEAENAVMDEPDHVTTANSLPEDHPIEWLAEAKEMYRHSLPPFVTKQKLGARRMVELPLAEGRQHAELVEVVYRFWDAVHSFASIDIGGQRFIVKVFRGGATPYRPWLGPQTGFSETPLAFAKQVPRGTKSWATAQGKRLSLPKGWALKEDDEKDDDYDPAGRRKSVLSRGLRSVNYDLNDEEEELDEDPYQGEPHRRAEAAHSERSSNEGEYAPLDPSGDRRLGSNASTTQPPSKLINAVKKSLRVPKEQNVSPRPKQIKRRSIGGQGLTLDWGGSKRPKHKADFSSDSESHVSHKQAKVTKVLSPRHPSTNPDKVPQVSTHDSPALDAPTLSSYKQAHTTLRIALVPYPQQSVTQRLRSCMNIATFFGTAIGVSGYKGARDRIFGITATFDCKPDDDPDKSMVIREEWPDSFEVFLETVDGAESWTEEGGKCGVSVKLLLTEG